MSKSIQDMLNNIEKMLCDYEKEDIILWQEIHKLKPNQLPDKLPSNCIILVGNNAYNIIKEHLKTIEYQNKIKQTDLIDTDKIAFVRDIDINLNNRRVTYTSRTSY